MKGIVDLFEMIGYWKLAIYVVAVFLLVKCIQWQFSDANKHFLPQVSNSVSGNPSVILRAKKGDSLETTVRKTQLTVESLRDVITWRWAVVSSIIGGFTVVVMTGNIRNVQLFLMMAGVIFVMINFFMSFVFFHIVREVNYIVGENLTVIQNQCKGRAQW